MLVFFCLPMLDYMHSRLKLPLVWLKLITQILYRLPVERLTGLTPACGIEEQKDTQDICLLSSMIPERFLFKKIGLLLLEGVGRENFLV